MKPTVIDGTTLEGGGQLVRLSIGLAALLGKPVEINNIRGQRRGAGGLKSQHLTAIEWLACACGAEIEGVELKSKRMRFKPGCNSSKSPSWYPQTLPDGRQARAVSIDLKTPGAITLVLQALIPFILFKGFPIDPTAPHTDSEEPIPVALHFKGGTNVSGSPSIDYLSQVLLPNLALLGITNIAVSPNLIRGWSTGRIDMGSATITITPLAPSTTLLPRTFGPCGPPTKLSVTMLAPASARTQLRNEVLTTIVRRFPGVQDLEILVDEDSHHQKRLYLLVVAHTEAGHRIGRDWLYDQRIPSDGKGLAKAVSALIKRVVEELARELESNASFDQFMEDELVVYQALAEGKSSVILGDGKDGNPRTPTLHTRTAQWVVSELLGVEFKFAAGEARCNGVGFRLGPPQPADDDWEVVEREVVEEMERVTIVS